MTAVATEQSVRNQLFINGEFVDARSGKTFPTINPATEEKITEVASAGPEDVEAAVRRFGQQRGRSGEQAGEGLEHRDAHVGGECEEDGDDAVLRRR